jgi:hypothetical protein
MPESDIEKIALGLRNAEQLLIQMCQVHSALLNLVLNRCDLDPKEVRSLLSAVERRHRQVRSLKAERNVWGRSCRGDRQTMLASGSSIERRSAER